MKTRSSGVSAGDIIATLFVIAVAITSLIVSAPEYAKTDLLQHLAWTQEKPMPTCAAKDMVPADNCTHGWDTQCWWYWAWTGDKL